MKLFYLFITSLFILFSASTFGQSTEARFVGGTKALHQWLHENVLLLVENGNDLIFNRVHLSFQISEEGEITDAKILRKSQELRIDPKALVEKLKQMPRWIPATRDGSPVDSEQVFTIIVHYR